MPLSRLWKAIRTFGRHEAIDDDSGMAIVEFALSSVILLMTILGTLEFGLAVWRYNMASDLAQEGARWAAVRGTKGMSQATAAEVQTYLQNRSTGMPVTVTTTLTSGGVSGTCTNTSVNPGTLSAGAGICVTVQTSYNAFAGLFPRASINMSSTAKMVMAR